ncbi:MAG TPA: DUF3833 family protein [Gammaproteobacteria bacterium]|nr:DUF3833 family protein [Gammaproteobacteria bacterium]
MKTSTLLAITSLAILAGCSSMSAKEYAKEQPTFDMVKYLTGHTEAWGLAQSRSGDVVRRFRIEMDGVAVGDDEVKVTEHDFYSDGKTEQHEWVIRDTGPHSVTAESDQLDGPATGEQYGNTLNLHYTLKVRMADGSEQEFTVSDWFFLQDDCHLINRTYGSKWSFHAFDVMTFFDKGTCGSK